ncbi:EF-hand domain-containing protein [Altererythrobacter sp. CC-YST694]|uniref:EF-hand domain-containing protein n=1 Tax=Altererythrobacter sp. CC-YST694 TaxID=2755038 RepID=UPI001D01D4C9|nr:EF-hand domain-containing protein [Altererythrobacter sp. CC-YST694]MCB5424122.1 EF-hand domain-containing protein [Altererythrobacter sp. CC-YST694]
MRSKFAGLGVMLTLLAAPALHAQDISYGSGSDTSLIDRSRIKPRLPGPIAREKYDAAVAKMFRAADTNGDGTVTLAELNAAIEARRAAAIADRFVAIDTNRDRQISVDEFTAWQRELGSAVLNDDARAAAAQGVVVAEELPVELGKGRDEEIFELLLKPFSPTMLLEANTNYDGGVSLDELVAYQGARFTKADRNGDNWLTQDEIWDVRTEEVGERGPAGPGRPGGPPPPPPGN